MFIHRTTRKTSNRILGRVPLVINGEASRRRQFPRALQGDFTRAADGVERSALISFSTSLGRGASCYTQHVRERIRAPPVRFRWPCSPPPRVATVPGPSRAYIIRYTGTAEYMAPPSKYCIMEMRLLELHNFVLRTIAPRAVTSRPQILRNQLLDYRPWINLVPS